MDQKYIALAVLVAGIALLVFAAQTDSKSSFEDGSFMLQIAAGIAGAFCVASSLLAFGALLWMAL